MIKKFDLKAFLISLAIPLAIGGFSALITMSSTDIYSALERPPLAPPSWLFPVVWTVLYILMGISCYLIYKSRNLRRETALAIYGVQLGVNFLWPIFFFSFRLYTFSFIWILLLDVLVLWMISAFMKVNKIAAYLQIPYLIWILFASYLNLTIALLN